MSAPTFLAPEVVQSSAMDCGPAALSCLLEGFERRVPYGRLREACQTDVDGTSIDTLEDVAVALGLDAEQVVIPTDHLLRPEADALPAIVVVALPSGVTHFVVVWRVLGPWVQVMDPGSGRVWKRRDTFMRELYGHTMAVPAEAWHEWAASEEFTQVLRAQLRDLGCSPTFIHRHLGAALEDGQGWQPLARLDAAARMLDDLVEIGALRRGREVEGSIEGLLERVQTDASWIPPRCWCARALPPEALAEADPEDGEQVLLTGAVVLRVRGLRGPAPAQADEEQDEAPPLPPSLVDAEASEDPRLGRELLAMLRADGWLRPGLLVAALFAASVGMLLEAAILRGMVEIGAQLGLVRERLVAWIALVAFAFVLLVLEGAIAGEVRGMGRRLEARLRVAFLTKVPRLGARFFQSRLSSDMAERIHAMHGLRRLPSLGGQVVRTGASLVLTVAGVAWLDLGGALLAGGGAALLCLTAVGALPVLRERDLRFRTHGGALSRVYLDALLGLWPIRAHGATRAVRREHEQLLVEWMRAGLDLIRASTTVDVLQGLVGAAVVIAVIARHSLGAGEVGAMLLLVYWSMQLPALGQQLGSQLRQYPAHRSRALRLLEPLGAPDEEQLGASAGETESIPTTGALGLRFDRVAVVAGGHVLLRGINLDIAPGEHVAIVGASGAGKSTFVSLLLGWHRPAHGRVLVSGVSLDGPQRAALRRRIAWVDPAVALWSDPLVDNLLYGVTRGADAADGGAHFDAALDAVGPTLADAELVDLVANLPEGLQTPLGEGGARLSGGEGQRVRLARGLLRPEVGLVILDEPLRGLDRGRRAALLRRMRDRWSGSTLLCVTHDLEETLEFPRVLVIDEGRIVEDGDPRELAARTEGAYASMLAGERQVHAKLWRRPQWRRVQLRDGQLLERAFTPTEGEA